MCVLEISFVRYVTLDTHVCINQHVEYHMLVQSVHHSWQMKEHILEINIGTYLETLDKLCILQHQVLWEFH